MVEAVVRMRFPEGALPVLGHRCQSCGEEVVSAQRGEEAFQLARRLGLFGPEKSRRRKLQRTGNSITVSIDRELLRDVLPGAGPGTVVTVAKRGDSIIIRADDSAKAES